MSRKRKFNEFFVAATTAIAVTAVDPPVPKKYINFNWESSICPRTFRNRKCNAISRYRSNGQANITTITDRYQHSGSTLSKIIEEVSNCFISLKNRQD
jgi:hypothetical protein